MGNVCEEYVTQCNCKLNYSKRVVLSFYKNTESNVICNRYILNITYKGPDLCLVPVLSCIILNTVLQMNALYYSTPIVRNITDAHFLV